MSFILIAMVLLAICHFIYEGIIAPSLRLKLRFKLFALRDELRSLKVDHKHQLREKHFEYLQDSINSSIAMLPRFDIWTMITIIRKLESDKELGAKAQERRKILDDCNIPDITRIREKSVGAAMEALLVNSGMWLFLLVPVIVIFVLYKTVTNKIKSIVVLPKPDLEKIAPNLHSTEAFAT